MPTTKLVLIGSGLAGGLLTAYLGRRGYDADLYERRADPRAGNMVGGRSINLALSTRGIHALEQIGIADELLKHAIPMRGRMIHPAATGSAPIFVRYDVDPNKHINSIGRAALSKRARPLQSQVHRRRHWLGNRPPFQHLNQSTAVGVSRQHHRSRWRVFRSARVDAAQDRQFPVRRELSRPRLQRVDDSARTEWFVANGKERAPHLAAQKFHDDRASEPRWLVHLHVVLGI